MISTIGSGVRYLFVLLSATTARPRPTRTSRTARGSTPKMPQAAPVTGAGRPCWGGWRDCGASGSIGLYCGVMTAARDELHRLVERLPEDQVSAALIEVQRLAGAAESSPWPPAWFGTITAGRADISERVDELLAEGFGR